jgi:hypothetical protein
MVVRRHPTPRARLAFAVMLTLSGSIAQGAEEMRPLHSKRRPWKLLVPPSSRDRVLINQVPANVQAATGA